jgi:hypothetical protein
VSLIVIEGLHVLRYTHEMAVSVDRTLYPSLAQYLEDLPGGLEAYAQVQAAADYALRLRASAPQLMQAPTLPEELRRRLSAPWRAGQWIPCTSVVMMSLLLRDRLCTDEAAYRHVIFERCRQQFAQPMYRALMFVLSPSLVLMGSAKRWSSFYSQSTLTPSKMRDKSATLTLTYPDRLFPEPWLEANGIGFCAAISCAGAKEPKSQFARITSTDCVYEITWR